MKKLSDHISEFANQTVIVRANFDVPIEHGQVVDTTRIEAIVPTVKALRDQNANILLIAHYSRPEEGYDPELSLRPVTVVLEKLLSAQIEFVEFNPDFQSLSIPFTQPISLLENLRFWPQEEANDQEFSLKLASLAKFYVNDAFANCHRDHASIVSIPKHLPSFAGIGLAREIEILDRVKQNPEQPLVVVLGGAKLETKEPLIETFLPIAQTILVGGKIALDIRTNNKTYPDNVHIANLTDDTKDITPDSAAEFAQIIAGAKTVIWNGTMGVFEEPGSQQGTRIVAEAVNSTPAYTVIGGGDTETALTQLHLESGIDFISTGGGAMLTYLSSGQLSGINALNQ